MWRGEAQGLLDRLMIPSRSRAANSAFAAASFSVSSWRKGEAMGGPLRDIALIVAANKVDDENDIYTFKRPDYTAEECVATPKNMKIRS